MTTLSRSLSIISLCLFASFGMSPKAAIADLPVSSNSVEQVTSVSGLSDVRPTDWAFQSLQSLVERYGCVAGYPNNTFKGDRALTRYEFAAGLSACVNRINELITASTADAVKQEDLIALRQLQDQFSAELLTLRSRVDTIEAKQNILGKNQFSTTTKLQGRIILALAENLGGASRNGQTDHSGLVLASRTQFNLLTSFTGRDQLYLRLQGTNFVNSGPSTDTAPANDVRISFQSGSDVSNSVAMTLLRYKAPLSDRFRVAIATGANIGFEDMGVDTVNPLENYAQAAISRFGRYNPIYRISGDTGVGFAWDVSPKVSVQVAYLGGQANQPTAGKGLFNGNYGLLTQLVYKPLPSSTFAFTYVNAYGDNGLGHGTGSLASNLSGRAVSSNSYGIEANVNVTPRFQLGGWVGHTQARALTGPVRGDASVWNYAVTMGFPDLFGKGNLGGIIVGMQPKLTGTSALLSGLNDRIDRSTGYHVEAFQRFKISDNLSMTPGFIYASAPDHNDRNKPILSLLLRTTLLF